MSPWTAIERAYKIKVLQLKLKRYEQFSVSEWKLGHLIVFETSG